MRDGMGLASLLIIFLLDGEFALFLCLVAYGVACAYKQLVEKE